MDWFLYDRDLRHKKITGSKILLLISFEASFCGYFNWNSLDDPNSYLETKLTKLTVENAKESILYNIILNLLEYSIRKKRNVSYKWVR